MSELICRKTMMRFNHPGMCSPHGGCQPDKTEWQSGYDEGRRLGVKTALDERDQLRAELAGLRTGFDAQNEVIAGLKADVEAMCKEREGRILCELELFENLRDSASTEAEEHRQCMATYRPLRQANLDSVVKRCDDLLAAMGKGGEA